MSFTITPAQVITDTVSTGIPDGGTKIGGGQASALQLWKATDIDCLATGQTLIVPNQTGRFVCFGVTLELSTVSGAGTVPIVRLGNNGTWNNLVTVTTLTSLTTVNLLLSLTLATGVTAINIGTTGISLDVQTAALVYTSYKINAYVLGYIR